MLGNAAGVIHDRNDHAPRKYLHALIDESIGFEFRANR
jgi:hypothetical protein